MQQVVAWLFAFVGPPVTWASVILHARKPWRHTEMGRHLMAYAVTLAVIFSFASVRYFTRPDPWPAWLQAINLATYLALIAVVMPWRVWLQFKAARRS